MDIPYSQRVTVTDLYNGVEVTIRAGRTWQDIVAAILPAGGLIFGFWLFRAGNLQTLGAFVILVALAGCMLCYIAISRLWWLMYGVEIITAADGILAIRRKGLLRFGANQHCLLADAKDFYSDREPSYFGNRYNTRTMGLRGTLRFTCGGDNYRFGDMIEEYEADKIIARMREKKLIN